MSEESIKVAVRVRPFNQREKDRAAKLIIKMDRQSTVIEDPENPAEGPKQFTFDYSYWSHDGFVEKPDGYLVPASSSSPYASQQRVFDDLGRGVLENAFEGFNCSLFAYGQTGSGKSYSVMGYGVNKGIVPITCEVLFDRISKNNIKSEVTFSMLEIYNEQVTDLLSSQNQRGGLQVRQHPSQGYFYAQGLKKIPVGSFKEIEHRIEEGTANRTVASTNMNATSSRAHTVVTITFDQITITAAGETKKSSVINLVDLAGSERADSTGATGDRLKEGANINKSLSCLGNVISALAEISSGSKKKIVVPYRESILTKLLQNALGGNSKTIMIAAVSPADINFGESLSTLRYADRAKRIKTKAFVNENAVDKLIRELKEENDRLKAMLESGKISLNIDAKNGYSKEEIERMKRDMLEEARAQLQLNQQTIQDNSISFKERLQRAQQESEGSNKESKNKEIRKNKEPYITNLNEDPLLSHVIFHFLGAPKTRIGRDESCEIVLTGLHILSEHALITNKNGIISIEPMQYGAKIKVNGHNIDSARPLDHNDRILIGPSQVYIFINPLKQKNSNESKITWDLVQKELAEAKGFSSSNQLLTKDQLIVQEKIVELLPIISEVNAISEELNKYRFFEIILVPSSIFDGHKATKQMVAIKMTNLQNMNAWIWDSEKLMNRRYLMQENYQRYLEGDTNVVKLKKEEDPFWEPVEDLFLGISNFFIQSLGYCMDFEEKAYIIDYKGNQVGTLYINVIPCSSNGDPLGEEAYLDDPKHLLSKPYFFKVFISNLDIIPTENDPKGFKLKFKFFEDPEIIETPVVPASPDMRLNFTKIIQIRSVTNQHLSYFESGFLSFMVFAVQKDSVPKGNVLKLSTRELKIYRDNEANKGSKEVNNHHIVGNDLDPTQIKLELSLLQRKYELLDDREKQMERLCQEWSNKGKLQKETQILLAEVTRILKSKPKK